jgi:hypothetical protein
MSDKPYRYGIKAYLVSESESGYTCNIEVYTGKSHKAYFNNTSSKGSGERKEELGE